MAQQNAAPAKQLIIHKYPNRRYYDTTRSTHVTLEEIYRLICKGFDVAVRDSKTGEDITTKVLAQIILEHDPPKMDIFPVELLHQVIRSNEKMIEDFVTKYLTQAFEFFCSSQQQFQSYLNASLGLSHPAAAPGTGTAQASFAANPFMAALLGMPGGWPMDFWNQQTGFGSTSKAGESTQLHQQIKALQQENRELKQQLSPADSPFEEQNSVK